MRLRLTQALLNPNLPGVEVFPRAGVVLHEKAFAGRSIADVSNDDFAGINRCTTSKANQGSTSADKEEGRVDAIDKIILRRSIGKFSSQQNALSLKTLSLKA